MSRFADDTICVLMHHVEAGRDRRAIFSEKPTWIMNLAGVDRLRFSNNGTLLSVKVFETPR